MTDEPTSHTIHDLPVVAIAQVQHPPLGFTPGLAAMSLGAARRCLERLLGVAVINSVDDGLYFSGETCLGVLALEAGVREARTFTANNDEAMRDCPIPRAELDDLWARLRALRSDVIAHMDTWISTEGPELQFNGFGVSVRGSLVLPFSDWRTAVQQLEPWARNWGERDTRPVVEVQKRPQSIEIPTLRKRRQRS
jgi:hypothetical protein